MEESHLEDLTALDKNPEVRAYFPNGTSSQAETQKRIKRNWKSFEEKGYCDFAVIHKQYLKTEKILDINYVFYEYRL